MLPLKRNIVYVARDIERAMGLTPSKHYHIVTNRNTYAEEVKKQYPEYVTLIETGSTDILDTAGLLSHERTRATINNNHATVLVFKNNTRLEAICAENGWTLLNPSAALAEKIENKITQINWLGELGRKFLPPHEVGRLKDIKWQDKPLILQWAHSHSGDGTIRVKNEKELKALVSKFPDRETRATAFIAGPSFTVNAVVTDLKILMSNISYQITGLEPFTDNEFTTVGNDWALTHSQLNDQEIGEIETMVQEIGLRLQASGWKGLFGLDIIRDDATGRMLLIEINARQPASTTFESHLQNVFRAQGVQGITIFEAHLTSLLGDVGDAVLIPINDGAQVIQRITMKTESMSDDVPGSLELAGYKTIEYSNIEPNTDLLRIMSDQGIMETHGQLNKRGKEIVELLKNSKS